MTDWQKIGRKAATAALYTAEARHRKERGQECHYLVPPRGGKTAKVLKGIRRRGQF